MAKKKGSGNRKPAPRPASQTPARPLSPRPQKAAPSTGSGTRRELERRSAVPLAYLHRMPRWLIPVLMGVLLLLGLFIQARWAGVFFLLIGAFLAWLVALSWPVITPGSRVLRLAVTVVVLGYGVARIFGWLA
jgi:hypothetical protein